MTKTLLFLSAALVCAQGANAQAQNNATFNPFKQAGTLPATAAKTTANASRLIAVTGRTFFTGNLEIQDSAHCWYPSGYGYDYTRDQWKFDNGTGWDYINNNYVESFHMTNTIDASGRVTQWSYEEFDGSNWTNNEIEKFTYDGQGRIDIDLYASLSGNQWDSSHYVYTYNATTSSKVAQKIVELWDNNTSQWQPASRNIYIYDANSNLVSMIYETWDAVAGHYVLQNRNTNTYTGNQLTLALYEHMTNNQWTNSWQVLYTYDAAGNISTKEEQVWNQGAWDNADRTTYTYNSTNDAITATREDYMMGAYQYTGRVLSTYNGYHQVLTETEETYNTATSQFEMQDGDNETRNYYEEYTNSVKDTKTTAGSFTVYPVPAKDELHLRTSLNEAIAASVQLFDMNGRMVKQQQLPTAKQHSATIDVTNLPAGNYIIQLNAGGKVMTQKVTIE